jgi:hypothetical protein
MAVPPSCSVSACLTETELNELCSSRVISVDGINANVGQTEVVEEVFYPFRVSIGYLWVR